MRIRNITRCLMPLTLLMASATAYAGKYADPIQRFANAGERAVVFSKSRAFAVFPTIGSVGFQAGDMAYSQMSFFEDQRALEGFNSWFFEFAASLIAIAISAGASASAGTMGATPTASGGKKDAITSSGGFQKGTAVFTIAKGGLIYVAIVAGQKFTYTPRGA